MSVVSSSQVETLLETVLFESSTLAAANAASWQAQVPAADTTAASGISSIGPAMAASPEGGIVSEVLALYMGVLNRVPQAAELQYYVNLLESGASAAQIAQGPTGISADRWNAVVADFANSPEFQADLSGSDVITALYHNVLGRAPGGAEVAYYQGLLAQGASTTSLIRDFVDSPEFRAGQFFQLAGSAIEFIGEQQANGAAGASSLTVPGEYASFVSSWYDSTVGGVSTSVVTIGSITSTSSVGTGTSSVPISTITLPTGGTTSSFTIQLGAYDAGALSSGSYHVTTLVLNSATPAKVTLGFDTLSDSFAGTAVDVSHAVSEPQALDLAAAAAGALPAASAKLEWFQFGGNTYMVEVTNSGAASTHTALAATDYIVKLTGLVDLSGGSFNGGHNFTL